MKKKRTNKKKVVLKKEGSNVSFWKTNKNTLIGLTGIILLSLAAYWTSLGNGFTNWDDPFYVTENAYIGSLKGENLKQIFTKEVALNYHPITMLSLAVDYQMAYSENPKNVSASPFHRSNLILHLLNILLVFGFIFRLSNGKKLVALTAALLFAVHPIHVESVAWISERKDVLYAFFFLSGLIAYLQYLSKPLKLKYLLFTFLLFSLSCLSKPTAVMFPVILLLVDFFMCRKWTLRNLLEKIPFFIVSILIGLKTIAIQSTMAIGNIADHHLIDRLMFASYGILAYLGKLILPIHLTAHYAYPNSPLPVVFWIAPFLILGLLGLIIYSIKKIPVLAFGLLFFLVMSVLTLQFISVGTAIIAERYTYIPFLGLYFIIGYGIHALYHQPHPSSWVKKGIPFVIILIGSLLAFRTHMQCKVWQNSETLWKNAITVAPKDAKAYSGLADFYMKEKGDQEMALVHLNKALELNPEGEVDAYINRSTLYRNIGNFTKALSDAQKAVSIKNTNFAVYNNLGNTYLAMKNFDLALSNFEKVLELSPNNPMGLANVGAALYEKKEYEKSIQYYDKTLAISPNFANAYLNRAFAYSHIGQTQKAILDYDRFLSLQPNHVEAYYFSAKEKIKLGQFSPALNDLNKAIQLNPSANYLYSTRAEVYNRLGQPDAARADLQKAGIR